jgi:hypothetical protein
LRVAKVWQATAHDKSLRSPPSPVSVAEVGTQSTVHFSPDGKRATESLLVSERFEMHDGSEFQCETRGKLELGVSWGRRRGEAAVELARPAVMLARRCTPAGFDDAALEPAAGPARFVKRDDRLVAVEPPLEKRVYLPLE